MILMECAFESMDYRWRMKENHPNAISNQAAEKAKKFGMKYDNAKERALAVFLNIVENGGTFIP